MRRCLFFLLVSVTSCLFGNEQELTVHVPVEASYKIPVIIGTVDSSCSVKKKFFQQVLSQDLVNSGHFSLARGNLNQQPQALLLSAEISANTVSVHVINNKANSLRQEKIDISTKFTYFNRQTIHHIADEIVKKVCRVPGIASSRILYSFFSQKPTPGISPVGDIRVIDYDGNEQSVVAKQQIMSICPSFIPAEKGHLASYFLYVSYETGTAKIFLKSLNENFSQKLISLRGNQLMPVISRKRDKIAFISDVKGNPDLFIQDFSPETGPLGPPRQLLTAGNGTQGSPTFDPHGKKIAFVSNRDGVPRIYVVDCDPKPGTVPVLISKKNRENTAPSWSPDGSKLAYSSLSKGVRQIWVYDFKTGKEKEITSCPGNKEHPSWAPDNSHLVFSMNQHGCSNLYITDLIDGRIVKITHGPGEKLFPSWEPIL